MLTKVDFSGVPVDHRKLQGCSKEKEDRHKPVKTESFLSWPLTKENLYS
jgi:hypothetical protein